MFDSAPAPATAPDPWCTWEDTVLELMNHGHGHVLPRPDGMAQKCRKAPGCPVCLKEVRALQRTLALLLKSADDGREAIRPLGAGGIPTSKRALASFACRRCRLEVTIPRDDPSGRLFVVGLCQACDAQGSIVDRFVLERGGIVSPGRGPALSGESAPSEDKVVVDIPVQNAEAFRLSQEAITEQVTAALAQAKRHKVWPEPERAMWDVFPGQLRLDAGEPL